MFQINTIKIYNTNKTFFVLETEYFEIYNCQSNNIKHFYFLKKNNFLTEIIIISIIYYKFD